ncbi:hypothetical protein ARMGADRAFT_1035839 [Armillaria gallica]|uniref:Uncharacterized protein n=1 Tax=Armillaria gallica TaxID=47427 RepID=A0A2H3D3Z5_ARMGA|nr:hypothetical protein ARMGADRAFT_1035839 [Armillaria gallica]
MSKNFKKKRNLQNLLYAATRVRTVIISRFYGLSHEAIAFRIVLANEGGRCKHLIDAQDDGFRNEKSPTDTLKPSSGIRTLILNNRNLPKRRPKGDPPKIFVIIQRGPVIEVVHADLAYADFSGGVKRTGKDSCVSVSEPSCSPPAPYILPAKAYRQGHSTSKDDKMIKVYEKISMNMNDNNGSEPEKKKKMRKRRRVGLYLSHG